MEGRCPNFPLVYGYSQCDDVYFFSPRYRHLGEQYACLKTMRDKVSSGRAKQMTALFCQGISTENLANCQNLRVPTDYLISELAREDLSSWAMRSHTVDEWRDVIHQVLETIAFMGREMKISHHDLHWGNILLKTITDEVARELTLIHDFGKAGPLTFENRKDDAIKFLSSWTATDYVLPPEIVKEFQENEQLIQVISLEELLNRQYR